MLHGGYKAHEVFKMGYFEAYRLFWILDELRARDLQQLSLVLDYSNGGNTEFRQEVTNWLNSRQVRLKSPRAMMPKDVWEKFAEGFENG